MTRRSLGLSLLLLVVACGPGARPSERTAETTTASSPAASTAPPEQAPQGVGTASPAPPEPTLPASYRAFLDDRAARCPRREKDTSTAGMVAAVVAETRCVEQVTLRDLARLPPRDVAALLEGDPASGRGRRSTLDGTAWKSSTREVCEFHDTQQAVHGSMWMWGTMFAISRAECVLNRHLALGYLVQARIEDRAADVASLLTRLPGGRPDIDETLARWRRYAAVARRTAPHGHGRGGNTYRLGDAGWIRLERDLDRLESSAITLAGGPCAIWSGLVTAVGGEQRCRALLRLWYLPVLEGDESDRILAPDRDAVPEPPDPALPPPADDAYDAATYALRRRCNGEISACTAKELADARAGVASRPQVVAWAAHVAAFRDRLCSMDLAAGGYSDSASPDPWLRKETNCDWGSGVLLTAYVLRQLAAGDTRALVDHMKNRTRWGRAVLSGLESMQEYFQGPCVPGRYHGCPGRSEALRPRAALAIEAVIAQGKALGDELCRTAPEIDVALGSTCKSVVAAYVFSFSDELGRSDLLR